MKFTWRTELPQIGLVILMFVLAAVTWGWAPDRIPVRWNLQGDVTRYGSKAEGLLLLPALGATDYLFLLTLPSIDLGRANYPKFAGAYNIIRVSLLSLIALAYGSVHVWVRGYPIDVGAVIGVLVGALLLVFGAVMSQVRPNWFFGIRTPWTLSSHESWSRTHRAGGWLFIAAGLWTLLLVVVRASWVVTVWSVLLAGGTAALVVYSYVVWRSDPHKVPPAGPPAASPSGSPGSSAGP